MMFRQESPNAFGGQCKRQPIVGVDPAPHNYADQASIR